MVAGIFFALSAATTSWPFGVHMSIEPLEMRPKGFIPKAWQISRVSGK